jgi:hypothetical protein
MQERDVVEQFPGHCNRRGDKQDNAPVMGYIEAGRTTDL